tara:strand:- start:1060 stop:1629 length:570 start_codon:yes stop_codon:yes gene_type:complete
MSSGAALAAAHRRRAGGAKNVANQSNNTVNGKSNMSKPAVTVESLVLLHDRQIDALRTAQVEHDAHWDECDGFLKTMADNYDSLNAKVTTISAANGIGPDIKSDVTQLSRQVNDLIHSAATKDEVIALAAEAKGNRESDEDSETAKKISKLEGDVTKLRSVIMQLQNELAQMKAEQTKGKGKKSHNGDN